MIFSLNEFYAVVVIGIGATLILDLWSLLLLRIFKFAMPNYCLVGRWVLAMPSGVFWHQNIMASRRYAAECLIGWGVHYLLGIGFAIALILLMSPQWLHAPTFVPALLFGVITVLIPYLIMQPAFGFGIAAAKTPQPMQARLRSLMAHTVFGIGLYLAAVAVRASSIMSL